MPTNLGLAVVDATGYDYSKSTSQTVTGLYNQIDIAYKSNKPILLYGWNYDGTTLSPMMVYVMPLTNAYIIDGKISVSNTDAVVPLS